MKSLLVHLFRMAVVMSLLFAPACRAPVPTPIPQDSKMVREIEAAQKTSTFPIVVPGYLPDGYRWGGMEIRPTAFQDKGYTKVSMTFGNSEGYYLEIRETDVPALSLDLQTSNAIRFKDHVKGVFVVVEDGGVMPRQVGNQWTSVPAVAASWIHKGILFWLHAPDMGRSEIEKIVASTVEPGGRNLLPPDSSTVLPNTPVASTTAVSTTSAQRGEKLQGPGTRLILEVDVVHKDTANLPDETVMARVQQTVQKRLDALGIAEAVQKQGNNRLTVELPPVDNPGATVKTLTARGKLTFKEPILKPGSGTPPPWITVVPIGWKQATGTGSNGQEVSLTGSFLKPNARVETTTGYPVLSFEFDDEGTLLMKQISGRLVPTQGPLGIFMDDQLISAPLVMAIIENEGVIQGIDLGQVHALAVLINSGSLEAPVIIVQQQEIP